jgi:hypothetical protein
MLAAVRELGRVHYVQLENGLAQLGELRYWLGIC